MSKIKNPIVYKHLSEALLKYSDKTYIDIKKAKWVLGKHAIPKHISYKVLMEMEECNLIKRINQRKFKIKGKQELFY